jgi:hypothetical protein
VRSSAPLFCVPFRVPVCLPFVCQSLCLRHLGMHWPFIVVVVVVHVCRVSCVRAGIHGFVVGLFDATKDETSYRAHMRDFLIELKEFSAEDNAELFMDDLAAAASRAAELELERRRGVPGLLTMDDLEDL